MDIGDDKMFDKSLGFIAGKTYKECSELVNAINNNCDCIYFDRIPMLIEFNHNENQYEIYTYKEYQKALEFCLKDMYWS